MTKGEEGREGKQRDNHKETGLRTKPSVERLHPGA